MASSEDEDDRDDADGHRGLYYPEISDEDDEEDMLSRPEAVQLLEKLVAQEHLVAELRAQISRLTVDLSRKCERDEAVVIHVSPELW